jgi:hypothetical protein
VPFTTLGISYQQALRNYLTGPLGGVVTAASTRLAAKGASPPCDPKRLTGYQGETWMLD